LLKGAFMTYLLPLLFLFIFALFAQFISATFSVENAELVTIIFSVLGFYLGLQKLKSFSKSISDDERFQPVIIKISGKISPTINFN